MSTPIVLSCYQTRVISAARKSNLDAAIISVDLGFTPGQEVRLSSDGVSFMNGESLTWDDIDEVDRSPQSCFRIEGGQLLKIQDHSEYTDRHYSLYPTERAPTMLLSGIPMHRIKGIDPYADTQKKIKVIKPLFGKILDTATGLGYTAISAAATAEQVNTIELDPAVLRLAKQNPWSRALFDNPRINQIVGDSFEKVEEFSDGFFSKIIHDPPMFSLAGDLYSTDFYRTLYRVLKNGGVLFHYIGDLHSKSGHRIVKGVHNRLLTAGFQKVVFKEEAFGLLAYKY